jgi:hypothetical protein
MICIEDGAKITDYDFPLMTVKGIHRNSIPVPGKMNLGTITFKFFAYSFQSCFQDISRATLIVWFE